MFTSASLLQKFNRVVTTLTHEPREKWRRHIQSLVGDLVSASYQPAYVELTIADGLGSQTTSGTLEVPFNQFDTIEHYRLFETGSVDLASGSVIIPERGTYSLTFHASYRTNIGTNEFWKICFYVDGEIIDGECTKTTQGSGKDEYNSSLGGIHEFNEGQVVQIILSGSTGPAYLSSSFANFTIHRIA